MVAASVNKTARVPDKGAHVFHLFIIRTPKRRRCWTAAQRERQPVGERDRKDDGARVVRRRRNEGGTRAISGGELYCNDDGARIIGRWRNEGGERAIPVGELDRNDDSTRIIGRWRNEGG